MSSFIIEYSASDKRFIWAMLISDTVSSEFYSNLKMK